MPKSITPEMRDLQRAVYEGGQDAGMQLPGRSDWGEFTQQTAGSGNTNIGLSGEMYVAVGEDGQLVNQARHRAPGDEPSTHLLKVDVRPAVTFGEDGNVPIIRWVSNVTVFELHTNRVVMGEESADVEGEKALAGDRPVHVYMNDPEYRAARPGFLHETPREAVAAALQKISSDGRINLPGLTKPITWVDPDDPDSSSKRPAWLIPLLSAGGFGAIVVALFMFWGGGDGTETETAAAPAAPADGDPADEEPIDDDSAVAVEPVATTTTTTTTTTSTTTTSTTTTTTLPPIEWIELDPLDSRCVNRATGDPADDCVRIDQIRLSRTDDPRLTFALEGVEGFGPDVTGTLSFFLTNDVGPAVLLECNVEEQCRSWTAPSYYGVVTDWQPIDAETSDGQAEFTWTNIAPRLSLQFAVPELENSNGETVPAGTYTVSEAVIFVEEDGLQSTTLFGDENTVWFP